MKIIQHGAIIEFTCPDCECKWEMTVKEARELNQDLVDYQYCDCPDCGNKRVRGYIRRMGCDL